MRLTTLSIAAALIVGCSSSQTTQPLPAAESNTVVIEQVTRSAPGMVEYVWEEPMVDVIEIPPGLDPDGRYYRPAHQSIVEIRQGRWKYYRPKSQ